MIDDETLVQMADSPSGWPDFFYQLGLVRVHRWEVVSNEDAEGADQEPGHGVERRVSVLSHWWTKS